MIPGFTPFAAPNPFNRNPNANIPGTAIRLAAPNITNAGEIITNAPANATSPAAPLNAAPMFLPIMTIADATAAKPFEAKYTPKPIPRNVTPSANNPGAANVPAAPIAVIIGGINASMATNPPMTTPTAASAIPAFLESLNAFTSPVSPFDANCMPLPIIIMAAPSAIMAAATESIWVGDIFANCCRKVGPAFPPFIFPPKSAAAPPAFSDKVSAVFPPPPLNAAESFAPNPESDLSGEVNPLKSIPENLAIAEGPMVSMSIAPRANEAFTYFPTVAPNIFVIALLNPCATSITFPRTFVNIWSIG